MISPSVPNLFLLDEILRLRLAAIKKAQQIEEATWEYSDDPEDAESCGACLDMAGDIKDLIFDSLASKSARARMRCWLFEEI